jgi:hypothetical protein
VGLRDVQVCKRMKVRLHNNGTTTNTYTATVRELYTLISRADGPLMVEIDRKANMPTLVLRECMAAKVNITVDGVPVTPRQVETLEPINHP